MYPSFVHRRFDARCIFTLQHEAMNQFSSLLRRLENVIRPGTVAEFDPATARCRVQTGNLLTTWLPSSPSTPMRIPLGTRSAPTSNA